MISFFVPGVPKPQGSKRAFVHRSTGRAVMIESAGAPLKDWRGDIKRFAIDAMDRQPALAGPIAIALEFRLPRPKSHPKSKTTYPIARPDADKLARGVLDALTTVCFADDSQITCLLVWKKWATVEWPAGCHVTVWDNSEESDEWLAMSPDAMFWKFSRDSVMSVIET